MAIRIIRENGDEILIKKSREVEEVNDKIRQILDDMVETLHKYNGVGLAAPQIGILKRLVVIDLYDDKDFSLSKFYFNMAEQSVPDEDDIEDYHSNER